MTVHISRDDAAWIRNNDRLWEDFSDEIQRRIQNYVIPRMERNVDHYARDSYVRPQASRAERIRGAKKAVLADAIKKSITRTSATPGYYFSSRTLDHLAPHWHAIEEGSTKMIGKRVILFMPGSWGPSPARFRKESRAVGGGSVKGAIIRKPIEKHLIMDRLDKDSRPDFMAAVQAAAKAIKNKRR